MPSIPIAIPARLSRLGLSEVVNTLLEDLKKPVPFDFIISGDLLRSSVADHLAAKGVSTEDVIVVEYIFLPSKPEEDETLPHEDWVSGVSVLPSGALLTASYDNCGRVWAGGNDTATAILQGHSDSATCCTWVCPAGSDGTALAVTGSSDFTLRGHAVELGGEGSGAAPALLYTGHEASVQAVAAHQPSGRFCSASWDKTVKVWEAPSSDQLAEILAAWRASGGVAAGGEVKKDGSKKAKVDGATKSASVRERGPLCTLIGHTHAVTGVAWDSDGSVVSCGMDHSVRAWDVETQVCTSSLSGLWRRVLLQGSVARAGLRGGGGEKEGFLTAPGDVLLNDRHPRSLPPVVPHSPIPSLRAAGHSANGVAANGAGLYASAHVDRAVRVW